MVGIDPAGLREDFVNSVESAGTGFVITNWSGGGLLYSGTSYDEEYPITASGTGVSGVGFFLPLSDRYSSEDAQYVKEGRLWRGDIKMFLAGSVSIDTNSTVKINNGSVYDVLSMGVIPYVVSGTTVFKKVFLRSQNLGYGAV